MPNEPIDTQFILYQLRRQGITNRNDVIKTLRASGLTSFEANEVLNAGGLGNLTRAERSGFPKTYKGQIGKGAKRNLREIAASFPTLIGAGIMTAKQYNETVKELSKKYPLTPNSQIMSMAADKMREDFMKSHPRFAKKPAQTVYDLMLEPYNITAEKTGGTLTGKGPQLSLDDIVYGVADNPLYAGLDILTLGGGRILKGIGKGLGKTSIAKRQAAKADFNRMLNTAKLESEKAVSKQEPLLKQFNREWLSLPDEAKVEISRALQQTGETKLSNPDWNKALKLARVSSKRASKAMIEEGLITREENANNIIANYMGNNLGWDKVDHDTLVRWMEQPELMPNELKPLYEQGKKLQKQGRLAFVTQKVNPAAGIEGSPVTKAASYHEQKRFVGTRTPEEMAEYLPLALEFQANQTGQAKALKSLMERLRDYDPQLKKIKSNTAFYSTDKVGSYINKQIAQGKKPHEIIMGLPKATEKEIKSGKAMILPKEEKDALLRFSTGRAGNAFLNMWKRGVLGSPKWVAENFEQSALGNVIEGVTPKHVIRALGNLSSGNYPKEIDTLTKAYGYAGNRPSSILTSAGDALNRMWLGLRGTFTHGISGEAGKAARSLGEVPLGVADIVSNPMFSADAFLDKVMRLSNYEKHVDDLSKALEMKPQQVRDLASSNPDVFEALYGAVNKSLGDYTSRNYFRPTAVQDVLEAVSPFWKFPKNTITTTAHQIMDKPIGSQLATIIPSKVGKEIWYDKTQEIDPEMIGGYPTGRIHPTSGRPTMVTTESHPLTAVINQLSSLGDIGAEGPEDLVRGSTPLFSMIYPLTLRNRFNNPAITENWAIGRDPLSGKETLFQRDKKTGLPIYDEQRLSPLQYADWIGRQALKTTYSPTIHGMNEMRRIYRGVFEPAYKSIKDKTPLEQALEQATLYPAYDDAINPFSEGNVSANPTVGSESILGPLLGIREVTPYSQTEKSKRNAYKSLTKKLLKQKRPFLEGYVEYNVEK